MASSLATNAGRPSSAGSPTWSSAHTLRGVFGSHVAAILRRLRRLAASVRGQPRSVLASATGNPAELATRLVGLPVEAVTEDGSPRGPVAFGLWEPPLLDETTGLRRSANTESATWLAAAVEAGVRDPCAHRRQVGRAGGQLRPPPGGRGRPPPGRTGPRLPGRLPGRGAARLEQGLVSGRLLGLATTNALELGMDVGGLDAVVLDGYPGTVASMWQQAGRAGRQGGASLAVLVGKDDPLDAYLCTTPPTCSAAPTRPPWSTPATSTCSRRTCSAPPTKALTDADLELFGATGRGPWPVPWRPRGRCGGADGLRPGLLAAARPTRSTSATPAAARSPSWPPTRSSAPSTGHGRRRRSTAAPSTSTRARPGIC